MLSGRPPQEPSKTRWLVAAGACMALVAIPLLLWALIEPPSPSRPHVPMDPGEEVVAPVATNDEPSDGLRLVTGTVVDEEEAPVVAVTILIEGMERIRTVSDEAGRFTLEGVPLEAVTLLARGEGFEEGVVDLAEGQTGDRETVTIVLEPARGAEGLVLDPRGEPVSRALVSCSDHGDDPTMAMNTDAEGHFSLSSKAVGCEAVAQHPDFGDSDPTLLRAGDDNEIRLKEPASISGYVTDERGQPLSGVTISIERFVAASGSDSVGKRGTRVRVDDPRGEFTVPKLQAGTYVLSA
ncbi:MAG TPA: carboxypeptidase regulatory-like domain-containing protein, partial [Polyangiaceae bacterium]|nr:carboxypeptidase regulatory-like domain-containing protein [Polyangiaceae bacterium]